MANKEINDLTLKITPVGTEEVLIQETGGGTTKKALISTLGGSGVSYYSKWYLNTSFVSAGLGYPHLANLLTGWVEVNDGYLQPLGASMGYSAGIFQFPATGLWEVSAQAHVSNAPGLDSVFQILHIQACLDYSTGPTWSDQVLESFRTYSVGSFETMNPVAYLRITDTVEQRVQFMFGSQRSATIQAGKSQSFLSFKRIGS